MTMRTRPDMGDNGEFSTRETVDARPTRETGTWIRHDFSTAARIRGQVQRAELPLRRRCSNGTLSEAMTLSAWLVAGERNGNDCVCR